MTERYRSKTRTGSAIAAALLFNPMLGSLYAWSVFLKPLETELAAPRSEISIVFSVAILSFTIGAVTAPLANSRIPTASLPLLATALSAGGLALSCLAESTPLLIFGYGMLFGYGSGFGYSVTIQLINHALVDRRGLANGLGLGTFPLGAIGFSWLFGTIIVDLGARNLFGLTATLLLLGGLAAAALTQRSLIQFTPPASIDLGAPTAVPRKLFPLIWLGFFLAAACGVMVIGHAAGILAVRGGDVKIAMLAAVLVNFGNAGGRFGAGWSCDHLPPGRVAAIAHVFSLIGFLFLVYLPTGWAGLTAVTFIGLGYGIASGAYPSAVSLFFGVTRYGRNFGILITAWGIAGLGAPWAGGLLFDLTGDYVSVGIAGLILSSVGLLVTLAIGSYTSDT